MMTSRTGAVGGSGSLILLRQSWTGILIGIALSEAGIKPRRSISWTSGRIDAA